MALWRGPHKVFESNGLPILIVPYTLINFYLTSSNLLSWISIRLKEVHLYPQVPTAPKTDPLIANSKLASSATIVAAFPPNSSKHFPNLFTTVS